MSRRKKKTEYIPSSSSSNSSGGSSVAKPLLPKERKPGTRRSQAAIGSPVGSVGSNTSSKRAANAFRTNQAGLSEKIQKELLNDIEVAGGLVAVCGHRNGLVSICKANKALYGQDTDKTLRLSIRNKVRYWRTLHSKGTGYIELLDKWKVFCSEATRNRRPVSEVSFQQDFAEESSVGTADLDDTEGDKKQEQDEDYVVLESPLISFATIAATARS